VAAAISPSPVGAESEPAKPEGAPDNAEAGPAATPDASEPGAAAAPSGSQLPQAPAPTAPVAAGTLPEPAGTGGPRRPTRYGLAIDFEHRPESPDLGKLVESTVLVNTAHPAYLRAVASRSEGYHAALSVGMALASVAVEPAGTQAFLTTFLARWGEAVGRDRRRRQPRARAGT
jgi:hypothetical protein